MSAEDSKKDLTDKLKKLASQSWMNRLPNKVILQF